MSIFNDYLQTVTTGQKIELERIFQIVQQAVPEAEAVIAYGMPSFTYKKKHLLHVAAFKNHMSIFGEVNSLPPEVLANYSHSDKGTLQFTEQNQLPADLIVQIVTSAKNKILKTEAP